MSKGKLLVVCFVWLLIAGGLAIGYKLIIAPEKERQAQDAEQAREQEAIAQKEELLDSTSSEGRYKHVINFGIDSFSGYSVLRSEDLKKRLSNKRIKLSFKDDGADYQQRLEKLKSGQLQMAAFTIDALIKSSSVLDENPATIVTMIDETRGADAMVAYKSAIPNLDALNSQDVKFVLTPDSPSETLTRVVMSHFNLDNLGQDPFIEKKDAEDVYNVYRKAKSNDKTAYLLWEPYVTKALENPNMHVVVDSSRFRGYIVDVIVVSRDFLFKNSKVVNDVLKAYFHSVYQYRASMERLVVKDAKEGGFFLSEKAASRLVKGIWWKNSLENFDQFGLGGGKLQHIEDMISNITRVLLESGAISKDPTNGKSSLLYYNKALKEMMNEGFQAGMQQETIRDDSLQLSVLQNSEWERLSPVGTLSVPKLNFTRGTDRLSSHSLSVLDELYDKLKTWPQYYLVVRGNASRRGDLDANKKLAMSRAHTAREYLVGKGIKGHRIKAQGGEPSGASSVSFIFGQKDY
ncbi:MAG: phosphate ABC transporter substrate-binding/OmpA family protein [Lentisphaeraceae bacterium]|nr:phosphate ABC transporter substrate-binding/OmpA family protein [Lentisphaeraceae bacterium]